METVSEIILCQKRNLVLKVSPAIRNVVKKVVIDR
jgi:hypothetical protein